MKTKRFASALLACLGLWQSVALAQDCGIYVEEESGAGLVFFDTGIAREYESSGTVRAVHQHYRNGDALFLRNVESGATEEYRFTADLGALKKVDTKWGEKVYTREEDYTYACAPVAALKPLTQGECETGKNAQCCKNGDVSACVAVAMLKDDVGELKRWCETSPEACLRLFDQYERLANANHKDQFNMYAEHAPLPPAQLEELRAACERHMTPELCGKSASQQWRAHAFGAAQQTLGMMCASDLGEKSCERFESFGDLELPDALPKAKALPCGEYFSTVSSLTGDMTFADRGTVSIGIGSKLRARLEDGLIKIRHDKGGDFVFARLADDLLLGLDTWNELELYVREKKPKKACAAPLVYKEVALSDACGLDKDPQACCATGDTQGCNRLGTMAAMSNDWKTAAQMYAKVCAKGVRVGCENWAYTIAKSGDKKGVQNGMKQLCAKDKLHVACDVLEVTNFDAYVMAFELEKLTKE